MTLLRLTWRHNISQQLWRWFHVSTWAFAGFALCVSSAAMAGRRPDVLFISLDTVRADYLTFLDSETAPNMTALARAGVIFSQALSGSSWTLPAHVQMFTGTPPVIHRVQTDNLRIDPRMPTLPEMLHQAGYYTAGFYTVGFLKPRHGFARGFDLYDSPYSAENEFRAPEFQPIPFEGGEKFVDSNIASPAVVSLAKEMLEGADPNKPLFLFAHFFDPHYDYIPPPPWDTKFDPDYTGDMNGYRFYRNRKIHNKRKKPPRQISDRDLEHIRSLYRGEIGWTDQVVGELLELFEKHRRLDSTLIIITADHGEEFYEHDNRGHRGTLFEELLRVPLLIVPPKALRGGAGTVVDQQVSLSDLLATVADFVGVKPPLTSTGRSLRPAMYGAKLEPRPDLSSLHAWGGEGESFHALSAHGLRTPEYKFIRIADVKRDSSPTLERVFYFDLVNDPGEQHPLTDPTAPEVLDAWRVLESELDQVRKIWGNQVRSSRQEHTIEVSQESVEQLIALGYMEPNKKKFEDPVALIPSLMEPMERMEPPKAAARRGGGGFATAAALLLGSVVAICWWRSRA